MVNLATVAVGLIVLAVLCIAAYVIIRDRRSGKLSCGCDCNICGGCSADEEEEEDE